MAEIIEVKDGKTILARYIPNKEIEKPGLNFYSTDNEFIQLARSVYIKNDQRSVIKGKINKAFGSELVEQKSYSKY